MSRSRDACDRFLPSTASISSTRVSFALDEVPASRPREFFRSRDRHSPGGECSSTQRFHAARVTVVDDAFRFSEPFIEPLSCLSRLLDVPACGSLRSGPHTEVAPRALCDAIREDLAVLRSGTTSIERYISSASVLRRLPRATGSGPDVASLSGFRWFCRQRAVLYTLSPIRCHAAFANTVVSIRPPFTSADLIDADASLSQM